MSKYCIRTNGRGNAWPILLGKTHPFYDINDEENYSNSSFSIIKQNDKESEIEKELLIDAGHGIIQYLLKNNNRIPEAIVLTHPHIDHSLSLDWVAQSYFRTTNNKFPVYANKMCWELTLKFFPHLKKIVELKELLPGKQTNIEELTDLKITFYPVFHGESALGAGMVYFEFPEYNSFKKALFTGDLLCPLLRNKDYKTLIDCDIVYTDSNNRFPYPNSNHWSISNPKNAAKNLLNEWNNSKSKLSWLIRPNLPIKFNKNTHKYFDQLSEDVLNNNNLCFSIFDFIDRIKAKNVNLVHYSGSEDNKHYHQEILNEKQLEEWTIYEASKLKIKSTFSVPKVGDIFK